MNIEIANRLVEMRKKKGLSQADLADKLGISRQSVSKWERAESSPDTDNLICLASLYGVSLDELLKTDEPVEQIEKEADEKKIETEIIPSFKKDEKKEESGKEEEDQLSEEDLKRVEELHLKRKATVAWVVDGVIMLLTAAAYIIASSLTGLWHPLWLIFFASICLSETVKGIYDRDISELFCFPVLVTGIYLLLGFCFNLWHPYWFLFILIPVFYVLADYFNRAIGGGEHDKDRKLRKKYYNIFQRETVTIKTDVDEAADDK